MRICSWLLAGLSLVAAGSFAAEAVRPKAIKTVEPAYPPAEEKAGHGGRVVVKVRVLKDGKPGDVTVHSSSGYPALDEAAVTAVSQWSFEPARDEHGEAMDAEGHYAIKFTAPEGNAIGDPARTCADLNAEIAVARRAHPDDPLGKVQTFNVTSGLMFVSTADQPMPKRLEFIRRLKGLYAEVAADCERNPEALYDRVFSTHFEKLGKP
jgi:TonB family protein